jgi:hypothetical protein
MILRKILHNLSFGPLDQILNNLGIQNKFLIRKVHDEAETEGCRVNL